MLVGLHRSCYAVSSAAISQRVDLLGVQKAIAEHPSDFGQTAINRLTTTIAPYLFVRTSGLSPTASILSDGSALQKLDALRECESLRDSVVGRACETLEAAVPQGFEDSTAVGRGLIAMKRNIFNGRELSGKRYELALNWLNSEARQLVEEARDAIVAVDAALAQFEQAHAEEMRRTRTAALHDTVDELFVSALAATNPSLHDLLQKVRTGNRRLSQKDHNQVSATAMRYLVRASRKTSPIATFGPVWTAQWEQTSKPVQSVDIPDQIECTRTVRAALVQREIQRLLHDWQNLAPDAPVKLNPTFHATEDGAFEWWVRRFDEASNAILAGTGLERVSGSSNAIAAIARVFESHPGANATVSSLRTAFGAEDSGPQSKKIDRALQSAWRAQMLLLVLEDRDDILAWARRACGLLRDDLARAIRPSVDSLSRLSQGKELPTRDLVEAYEKTFSQFLEATGSTTTEAPRPVITVDAHLTKADAVGHPQLPESLVSTLTALAQAMPALAFDTPSAEMRDALRAFFDERYPETVEGREELSSFLQAYFDAGGKSQADFFRRLSTHPTEAGDPGRPPRHAAGEAFLNRLAMEALSGKDFTMSQSEFSKASKEMMEDESDYVSLQYHLQPFDAGSSFVLNQIFPGACSTLTRFLPSEATPEQRAYLEEPLSPAIPIEINAAFGFNASAHPKLIDRALSFPPFPESSELEAVDFRSLWVVRDPGSGDLTVQNGQGDVYAPIYIAALNPMSLPKQFQALHAFCVNHWRHSGLTGSIIRRAIIDFDGFLALSRVTIGELVVLRRSWVVSLSELPALTKDSAEFFRAFNCWADERGLPEHLYYQPNVFAIGDTEKSEDAGASTPRPRLYKPMPLDRSCALGLELFQHATKKYPLGLLLSEALPTPFDQSYHKGGMPVAAELAVEITNFRANDD